ncbi:TonB-dependent receptor [Terrimonas pollutisoli]|uniref:TonB-dependent receptor n=1 Tax=Terrimonas pollutisoli TaxID=3034147 RepID=UPI0023EBF7ED|nr:TonB-dependent receptor [Terrimonas sp. H1YJ31]
MKLLLLYFVITLPGLISSAQKITISGYVKDETSKEALIGASVVNANNKTGTTTNQYGFFSLTVFTADTVELIISYQGYKIQAKKIMAKENLQLDVLLENTTGLLGEVIVTAGKNDHNVQKAQMGVIDVPLRAIKNLPVLLGERDLMKIIQLLPGVQGGQEGTTGFYVRGGNLDQNLVQLDEATVYNPNHLFGLFSTFNINSINNVQLIKGSFPAEYGGRLSSILNITMKEGNKTKYQMEGGIGLLSNNLTFQGPIRKNKSSFIVSARRSHIDLLLRAYGKPRESMSYKFYDVNAKMNFELGKKDHVFLSFFKGNDNAAYNNANSLNYTTDFGNSTATLRWNHLFGSKTFSNTSVIYNDYNLALSTSQNNYYSLLYTGIRDITAKTDLTITPNTRHKIKTGFTYTRHRLSPASFSDRIPRRGNRLKIVTDSIQKLYSDEMALYAGDEFDVSEKLSINYGLRVPIFTVSGKIYSFIEPRITAKLSAGSDASTKASYTKMNQFLHLIPNSTAGLPTDIWIPSSNKTKPQSSTQYALGYFRNFKDNAIETSVEFYYKDMDNQVLFGEGKQLKINVDTDSLIVYGKGKSFGAEFFVKKNTGQLTGWVSYTLSKTTQNFKDLNFGKEFPFKYDRRHVLSVTASYQLTKRWIVSSVFVYSTGGAYTVPSGRISTLNSGTIFEGNYYVYEGRNNYRLRSYHRLDLSASHKKTAKIFKNRFEREWVFGLYNTYSRLNPYFVYFEIDALTTKPTAKQVSLLPIIPAVSFNFKF